MNLGTKLASAAVLAAAMLGAPAAAGAATGPGQPAASTTWTVMPAQDTSGVSLTSVACPASSMCLALGNSAGTSVISAWNGSVWSPAAAPGTPDDNYLSAISCPTAVYCMAVGDNSASPSAAQPAAWQWADGRWTELPVGHLAAQLNFLRAVKCLSAGFCEAVGVQGVHPLAETWNGHRWTAQSTPASGDSMLTAVACTAPSRCEAVGATGNSAAFAMGWDGSQWRAQKMPAITGPGVYDTLLGVSCYRTGCTAVGRETVTNQGESTLAEILTGSVWALQSPVGSGNIPGATSTSWSALHCGTAGHCTAVGNYFTSAGGFALAENWNGHAWQQDSTPSPSSPAGLAALSCTAGTAVCTAVGTSGNAALQERN